MSKKDNINILVIHADQHRSDCLGVYNQQVKTPAIDSLCVDGIRFDQCFCTFPVCTPSRYSLLSGQYVSNHHGWNNHCTLASGIPTFPKLLRSAGYKTAAVGKMHFAPTYLDVGFDEMILCEQDGPGRWDDDYHHELADKDLIDIIDIEDQRKEYRRHAPKRYWDTFGTLACNLPEGMHSTDWIGEQALEQLNSWTNGGNLLMVGFVKPHHPMDPPQKYLDMYPPESIELLAGWMDEVPERDGERSAGYFPNKDLTPETMKNVTSGYFASITQIDDQINSMISFLKEKGLYDNTLIIYTSDHGDYMGFHHMMLKGNHMYDALMRVPMIAKLPHQRQADTVREEQISNLDTAGLILSQAGLDIPSEMEATDLTTPDAGREIVFGENGGNTHLMIRTENYKLLTDGEYTPQHLFNLKNDPMEINDLLGSEEASEVIPDLLKEARELRSREVDSTPYLNYDEKCIKANNVPNSSDEGRKKIIEYYANKAAEIRNLPPEAYLKS